MDTWVKDYQNSGKEQTEAFQKLAEYVPKYKTAVEEIRKIKNGDYRGWKIEEYDNKTLRSVAMRDNCPGDEFTKYRSIVQKLFLKSNQDYKDFIESAVLSELDDNKNILNGVTSFGQITEAYNNYWSNFKR